jgi:hypothetical protein
MGGIVTVRNWAVGQNDEVKLALGAAMVPERQLPSLEIKMAVMASATKTCGIRGRFGGSLETWKLGELDRWFLYLSQ